MMLFPVYVSLPLVALSAWLGVIYGRRLRSAGFTLRGRISARDLPGNTIVIPVLVLFVPPFLWLRNQPEIFWHFPFAVQYYSGAIIWTVMLCSFVQLGALICAISMQERRGVSIALVLAGSLLAAGTEAAVRRSPFLQPPQLAEARSRDGVVLQTSDATCAAAAVATLCTITGSPRSESEMVAILGTTAFGTSTAQVWRGLRALGYECRKRRIPDHDLRKLQAPAVLFVSFGSDILGHVVLYMGEKDGKFEILNPSGGRVFYRPGELDSQWLGHALEVSQSA